MQKDGEVFDRFKEIEKKFIVPAEEIKTVEKMLYLSAKKCPAHPISQVSTIYFDDDKLSYLDEKNNSDLYRSKFRMRFYSKEGQGDSDYVFWERKERYDVYRLKTRKETSLVARDVERMKLEEVKRLFFANPVHFSYINQPLFPVVKISFMRMRYISVCEHLRIRINLDQNITVLEKEKSHIYLGKGAGFAILEIKCFQRELPALYNWVGQLGIEEKSFSKYEYSMR